MGETDPLANIGYISIKERGTRAIGNFTLDPGILLPVEFPSDRKQWSAENISWEAIIAAMLKILAYKPDHEHLDYYRDFIQAVKPQIFEELTEAAVLKAKNRDFELAIEIFMALEGLRPKSAKTKLNLALVHEEKARHAEKVENRKLAEEHLEKAFTAYKRALDSDPFLPELHFNFAHFYLHQKSFDKAREHFERFLELGKDKKKLEEARQIVEEINSWGEMDLLFKSAFDDIKMSREPEGIEKIKRFLDSHPGVWNAWFLLGWGCRRTERYAQGKEALLKALSLNPSHVDTLNELAICLMELGELDECRSRLNQALKIEPENTKVISNLGILALKRGNKEKAKSYFNSVLAIDAEDPIAQKYLEIL